MKKMKYLRTWLVVALVVTIIGSLTGGTVAWFTDTVESTNNVIASGNLDMTVSFKPYGAQNTTWTLVEKDTEIFKKNALYEPGYTEAIWLKIENTGNLAFRYQTALNIISEIPGTNKAGERFNLSDYLVVRATPSMDVDGFEAFYTTRDSLDSSALKDIKLNAESLVMTTNNVIIPEAEDQYVLVVLQMPTTVGNEANHNGQAPQINLGLNVVATQLPYEEDSFGSDYDADATYPEIEYSDAPKAEVTAIEETITYTPYNNSSVTRTLDAAYTFKATEKEMANIENSPYRYWHADFVAYVDETLPANSVGLAGSYGNWKNGTWYGIDLDVEAPANTEFRMLKDALNNYQSYEDICEIVKEFNCGVYDIDGAAAGVTMTVELRLYEVTGTEPNAVNNEETGNYIVIGTYKYTF